MAENNEQIARLLERLELLLRRQQDFNLEVNQLRKEIQLLKKGESDLTVPEVSPKKTETPSTSKPIAFGGEQKNPVVAVPPIEQPRNTPPTQTKPKGKSNLEKFIGENLINKIGILITVIGVFIGAKYSIENNLISPLTRIILG